MQYEETKGCFGFHAVVEGHGVPAWPAFVQFYVKSSALSRAADLAISPHLLTEAEIDKFLDDAVSSIEAIRSDAKNALASIASS